MGTLCRSRQPPPPTRGLSVRRLRFFDFAMVALFYSLFDSHQGNESHVTPSVGKVAAVRVDNLKYNGCIGSARRTAQASGACGFFSDAFHRTARRATKIKSEHHLSCCWFARPCRYSREIELKRNQQFNRTRFGFLLLQLWQ